MWSFSHRDSERNDGDAFHDVIGVTWGSDSAWVTNWCLKDVGNLNRSCSCIVGNVGLRTFRTTVLFYSNTFISVPLKVTFVIHC